MLFIVFSLGGHIFLKKCNCFCFDIIKERKKKDPSLSSGPSLRTIELESKIRRNKWGKKKVHGSQGLFFKSLSSPPPPPPPSFPTPQRGRSENKKLVYALTNPKFLT